MYSDTKLKKIFQKTGGKCRCCGKPLTFKNHGADSKPDGWQVDHAKPLSRDGTNHTNNLWPMCVGCNRKKADKTWDEFKRHCPAAQPGGRVKVRSRR